MTQLVIGDAPLTIDEVIAVARGGAEVTPRRGRARAHRGGLRRRRRRHRARAGRLRRHHRLRPAGDHAHPRGQGPRAAGEPRAQPRGRARRAALARGRARRDDHPPEHDGARPLRRQALGGRAPGRVHQRRHRPVGAVAGLARRLRRPRPVRAPRAGDDGRGRAADRGREARAERACPAGRRARARLARGQRGPQPPQRHPVHGRHRLHARRRRRGAPRLGRPHRRDEPRGPARLRRPVPGAHPGAASHPRPAGDGGQRPPRDRRERHHAQPPQLRQGAGRLLAALHPAGARRVPRRARVAAARGRASRSTRSPTTR